MAIAPTGSLSLSIGTTTRLLMPAISTALTGSGCPERYYGPLRKSASWTALRASIAWASVTSAAGQDTRAIQHYLDHRVTDFGAGSVQRLLERLIRISSALDLATAAKLTEPGTKLQPLALLSF